MEQGAKPMWLQEVEVILNQQYQGDELLEERKKVDLLFELVSGSAVRPHNVDAVVALILNCASVEIGPRAGVYLGFQLGLAYEEYLKRKN